MSEQHPFMHFNVIRDFRQKGKVGAQVNGYHFINRENS
nr:hypothetical protein [Vibrio cholerae]